MVVFRVEGRRVPTIHPLDEGPQLITNIVGIPIDALANGLRVRAVFDHADPVRSLLRFEPDPDAGAAPAPLQETRT